MQITLLFLYDCWCPFISCKKSSYIDVFVFVRFWFFCFEIKLIELINLIFSFFFTSRCRNRWKINCRLWSILFDLLNWLFCWLLGLLRLEIQRLSFRLHLNFHLILNFFLQPCKFWFNVWLAFANPGQQVTFAPFLIKTLLFLSAVTFCIMNTFLAFTITRLVAVSVKLIAWPIFTSILLVLSILDYLCLSFLLLQISTALVSIFEVIGYSTKTKGAWLILSVYVYLPKWIFKFC